MSPRNYPLLAELGVMLALQQKRMREMMAMESEAMKCDFYPMSIHARTQKAINVFC